MGDFPCVSRFAYYITQVAACLSIDFMKLHLNVLSGSDTPPSLPRSQEEKKEEALANLAVKISPGGNLSYIDLLGWLWMPLSHAKGAGAVQVHLER